MENRKNDVAAIIGVDRKKAEEIIDECFDLIEQIQSGKSNKNHVAKFISGMKTRGKTPAETFYVGFVVGRIVQLHAYKDGTLDLRMLDNRHPEFA